MNTSTRLIQMLYIYAKLNQGLTFTLTRDNRAMPGLTYTFQKNKNIYTILSSFFFTLLIFEFAFTMLVTLISFLPYSNSTSPISSLSSTTIFIASHAG